MSDTLRLSRHRHARCRPRLERLESRQLLAALLDTGLGGPPSQDTSVLSVVQTTPANGDVLSQSPTDVLIQFNQPFDPFSLGSDIEIDQVNSDGTTTPVDSSLYSEPFSLDDPTNILDVSVNQALNPGTYQIVLSQFSTLQDLNGDPLANPGVDQPLADFTIQGSGVTLANATNLPTLGATPVVVSSSLDFQSPQGEAKLYQFTLPATQPLWQLGAEVSAQRDGGTLATALALFDSQGNPIATGDHGRKDAPEDPYLFAGLQPGTYYLGVSGAGDVPGQPGGYDPSTGTPGTINEAQPGGPFQLQIAATPAQPTTLTSFQLDHADPLDTRPTGLTLNFSAPLNLDSFLASTEFQAFQVVDQTGKVWSLTPNSYVENENQFSFVFDQPLPAGHYSLVLPASGGATDLAGQAPTAPGEPVGVLATWNVTTSPTTSHDSANLGALLARVNTGINLTDTLAPGQAITYRFVLTTPSIYSLTTLYSGGVLSVQMNGPDGQTMPYLGAAGASQSNDLVLNPGVYQLRLFNPGIQTTQLSWGFAMKSFQWEMVLSNGIGQGPALQLMLNGPAVPNAASPSPSPTSTPTPSPTPTPTLTPTPTPTPSPTPTLTTPTAPTPASPSEPTTSSESLTAAGPASFVATTTSAAPVSAVATVANASGTTSGTAIGTSSGAALVLTLGGSLVGSPSLQADHVAAVGPGSSSATALAFNSEGLPQGINYGPTLGSTPSWSGDAETAPGAPQSDLALALNGALVVGTAPVEPGPDDRVLALNEWIGQLRPAVLDWVALPFPGIPTAEVGTAEKLPVRGEAGARPERIAMVQDDTSMESSEAVDRADFAAPLGFVAATVGVMRLRRPLHNWFRRKGVSPAARSSILRLHVRRPHVRV